MVVIAISSPRQTVFRLFGKGRGTPLDSRPPALRRSCSNAYLLWPELRKRSRLIFARLVLPNRVRAPAIGVEVAAKVAPLLVGAPITAQFDLGRVAEPVERQHKLAERLADPCDDLAGAFVAGGDGFVADQAIHPLATGRDFF